MLQRESTSYPLNFCNIPSLIVYLIAKQNSDKYWVSHIGLTQNIISLIIMQFALVKRLHNAIAG